MGPNNPILIIKAPLSVGSDRSGCAERAVPQGGEYVGRCSFAAKRKKGPEAQLGAVPQNLNPKTQRTLKGTLIGTLIGTLKGTLS